MVSIVSIQPSSKSVAATLRVIAQEIEDGEIAPADGATLIIGSSVFSFGPERMSDDRAVEKAVWDCNYAVHKLMSPIFKGE
jgi:hypothetical protein